MNQRTVKLGGIEIPVTEFRELMKTMREMDEEDDCSKNEDTCTPTVEKSEAEPGDVRARQANIIESIASFLQRFVFLRDECLYLLVAAWIVATYLHRNFDFMAYLFAYSPERQSGKTTLLDLLDMLVYESTGVQVSPTEAVLFRTAEGHTQLLDEVDSWKNNDDLRDVLNAGYRRRGVVTRCDKSKAGFKPTKFPVYAPRALAGIGISILHQTTLDRTFAIAMARQTKSEKRERLRQRKARPEADALKKAIQEWVKEAESSVVETYANGSFPYLESFSDRAIEIAEPLAAILEVAYEGTKELARIRESFIQAISLTRTEQHSVSRDHQLLKHLLRLTGQDDPLVGNATEIERMCGNLEGGFTQYDVSRVLRNYGFKTKSTRLNGEPPLYRYSLSKSSLKEIVKRYVPSDGKEEDGESPA